MFFGRTLLIQWMLFDWENFFESIAKNCVALIEGDKFINAETKNIAFIIKQFYKT